MHSIKLLFLLQIGGAASDTLSVKSAAVLEATSGSHHVKTGSLSASTSNIDQAGHPAAGQKTSWPELTPRSLRKFAALGTGLKFMNILQNMPSSNSDTTNNARSAPNKSNCE